MARNPFPTRKAILSALYEAERVIGRQTRVVRLSLLREVFPDANAYRLAHELRA